MTEFINHFNGTTYSYNYVRRIMRVLKVKSRIRQKKSNYKKVKPEQVGENILERKFKADYPNQKWLTDVTEFKIQDTNKSYIYQRFLISIVKILLHIKYQLIITISLYLIHLI